MEYLLGIDGGGTGCRAAVTDSSGLVLGRGQCGFANIMTDIDRAGSNIIEASRLAFVDAGIDLSKIAESSALLGLAGANIGNYANQLVKQLPFRRCEIETDAVIALQGAVGDGDGTVAIIGTGSVFVSRLGDNIRMIGGWGFTVGDLGSGARLGRALLQEVLLSYDGIREGSELTDKVLRSFENDPRSLVEYAHTARPGEFGSYAPLIFEHAELGDPVALAIVSKAVLDVGGALGAILPDGSSSFCLLGGLSDIYAKLLDQPYKSLIAQPHQDALGGAVNLAVARFGGHDGK